MDIFLSSTSQPHWEPTQHYHCYVGLYWTSCPVQKSGEFSKFGLSGNRTFSFPDAGLLTLLKIRKNPKTFSQCYLFTDSSSDGELNELMRARALLENITDESVLDSFSLAELDEVRRAIALLKKFSEAKSTLASTSESKIATLMDMGFPRERCIEALQENSRYKTISDIFPLKTFILSKF